MAEAAQVAKSTYCNYEAGKRAPDALALAHLAQAGADVLYILTGQRAAGALAPDEAALLEWQREQAKGLMRGAWGDSLCG